MRKRSVLIPVLWLALTIIFSAGCNSGPTTLPSPAVTSPGAETPAQIIKDITVTEAHDLIQQNTGNPDFIIIDIRTPDEYGTGHLENSILIDYYAENFQTEIGNLDRHKAYLIYCRTANRSGHARDMMQEMGFTRIYNMSGGISAWTSQGFPVVE